MLMAVAAMMVLMNSDAADVPNRQRGSPRVQLEGLIYYLAVYLFMNLGAFAIVARRFATRSLSEEIDDYAGLGWEAPVAR